MSEKDFMSTQNYPLGIFFKMMLILGYFWRFEKMFYPLIYWHMAIHNFGRPFTPFVRVRVLPKRKRRWQKLRVNEMTCGAVLHERSITAELLLSLRNGKQGH